MERPGTVRIAVLVLGGTIGAMWAIELTDLVIGGDLDRHGILPRRLSGLDGVVWAPFLHGGIGHLLSNSVPFLVLGAFVFTEGPRRWAIVTGFVALVGGALTWLLARQRIHIGLSGVIFGYMGYLLGAAYYRKDLRSVAIAVVVAVLYGGGLLFGLLPRPGVSWEGHLFGAAAGVGAAILTSRADD